jgi:hypothetical protein
MELETTLLIVLLVFVIVIGAIVVYLAVRVAKLKGNYSGGDYSGDSYSGDSYSGGNHSGDYFGGGKDAAVLADGEVYVRDLFDHVYKHATDAIRDVEAHGKQIDGQKWWQEGMKKYYAEFDTQEFDWNVGDILKGYKNDAMTIGDDPTNEPRHFAYQLFTQIGGVDKCTPRKLAQLAMNISWFRHYYNKAGIAQFGPFKKMIEEIQHKVNLLSVGSYLKPKTKLKLKLHDVKIVDAMKHTKK